MPSGFSSIAYRQLSFLKITFIFSFHNDKFFPLNFSISYLVVMALKLTYALLTMNSTVYWNNGGRT